MQDTTTIEWEQARAALADEVVRVTSLLRSVDTPDVPALGRWNAAEVAMHLSQAWLIVPGLARMDLSEIHDVLPGRSLRPGPSIIGDLWELAGATISGVESDGERDLSVLADRIEARAADFLGGWVGHSPLERRPWLVEGTEVALATLTGHLLNETVVHGYDIARACGRRWAIEPSHAAMVFDGFLMPVIRRLDPTAMVHPERAAGVRATFDLRIRGGGRYYFVFDDGALHIEDPSDRRVDCHLSAQPGALLLVAWARRSQWPAIAKGQLTAWGRKPWLGPRLRSLMRTP
jgi:hypothetical protein